MVGPTVSLRVCTGEAWGQSICKYAVDPSSPQAESAQPKAKPSPPPVPAHGPGTELKQLLASLGIKPDASCSCNSKAAQMNAWGVDGCREHRAEIVEWMRGGAKNWGWLDKLKAAGHAVATGVAFALNPLDPFPGLVDEAIRRAEVSEPVRMA